MTVRPRQTLGELAVMVSEGGPGFTETTLATFMSQLPGTLNVREYEVVAEGCTVIVGAELPLLQVKLVAAGGFTDKVTVLPVQITLLELNMLPGK
jgi:hypothetical protein